MKHEQETTKPLPSRNESWGFEQTCISNGCSPEQAKQRWDHAFRTLDEAYDFGPEAIRRILDSPTGRHLADRDMESPLETFTEWMKGRTFKSRTLEIVGQTDEQFYGE